MTSKLKLNSELFLSHKDLLVDTLNNNVFNFRTTLNMVGFVDINLEDIVLATKISYLFYLPTSAFLGRCILKSSAFLECNIY